jgi:putative ABC transport system permease protein
MRPALLLAWRQLTHEPIRFLVALAGVAFAVILMLMQLGFRDALFHSSVRFHARLHGDLVVISPRSSYLALMKSFPRRRLYQALGYPQVASVASIYLGLPDWKDPDTGNTRAIFLIGFDPSDPAVDIPGVSHGLAQIQYPDRFLFDALSRPEFGPVARRLRGGQTVATEVARRRISVVGLYELGTSFGIDGSLVTSDLNFLRVFGDRPPGSIDIGLIRLKPGADPEFQARWLSQRLGDDVEVLTRAAFMRREIHYWAANTPIGYVFALGTIVAFVVGSVIVYQILFTDVSHHLPEYATLKAMGYTNFYLSRLVIEEAVLLAVLGFVPGVAICVQIFRIASKATMLPVEVSRSVGLQVLGLTLAMCCLAGVIAMRKAQTADPAEIF